MLAPVSIKTASGSQFSGARVLKEAGGDLTMEWKGKGLKEWAGANNEAKREEVLEILG